jgi:methionyl-tRNA formyltransferase
MPATPPPITIAIASSTPRALWALEKVLADPRFKLIWLLTPTPKPSGRSQTIEPNPLHQYGMENKIDTILVESKLSADVKAQITELPQPDFLLVVDFGYLIPPWLLSLPKIAPLNIHPAILPAWRGSSPGQFVLLYGENDSAVSVIVMNEQLDQGAILYQRRFAVKPEWTQAEYYQESFQLVAADLPDVLFNFAHQKITAQPQPLPSPTPIARRLQKSDSFVAWDLIELAIKGENPNVSKLSSAQPSDLLLSAYQHHLDNGRDLAQTLECATRAFSPWPQIWTIVQTKNGLKRMKILSCLLKGGRLQLQKVQLEGKNPAMWQEVQKTK